jgi:hypothetical protein
MATTLRDEFAAVGAALDALALAPPGDAALDAVITQLRALIDTTARTLAPVLGGDAGDAGDGDGAIAADIIGGLVSSDCDGPCIVLDYAALLHPVACVSFDTIIEPRAFEWLREQAASAIARIDSALNDGTPPDGAVLDGMREMRAHLSEVQRGVLPYGYRARTDARAPPPLAFSLATLLDPRGETRLFSVTERQRAWLVATAQARLAETEDRFIRKHLKRVAAGVFPWGFRASASAPTEG